ncbi:hypothetical protein DL98DRAFT_597821 [Cadophora sp. DSE1049]|nr:hypothetical protein DL98DRAFT_597821 [Cadophora sp. DSE1049]
MPAILLTNICTALGQVNSARGIASGIVVNPTAEFFEMDDFLKNTTPIFTFAKKRFIAKTVGMSGKRVDGNTAVV